MQMNFLKNQIFMHSNPLKRISLKKYSEETNIVLNNFALGEMEDEQYFNINYKGGLNSFYDVNQNTNWFRRQQNNKKVFNENFTLKKKK